VIHGVDTTFMVQVEVIGHPGYGPSRSLRDRLLDAGDTFALAPQVLAEFIHIVTDERRFERPLSVSAARERAEHWWSAAEVTHALPNEHTCPRFLAWMREHRLGRKRLLDTLLAATYFTNDVRSIVTSNARDFGVFGCFELPQGD
jgi:predicted nucleic acid-binding protein